ncbi:MAG: PD40 domain-containing protein [Kiritimatiellae bacterium]|nr:PD40 domain-containing protein [Kiritimatiellia bacterium]
MSKGRVWGCERYEYRDPNSGVRVQRLTHHRGHSHHLYFTNPGWYANGKRLLFGSDRNNHANLFGIDLASGTITQLTGLREGTDPGTAGFLQTCVNPMRDEAYFFHGRGLVALDLESLAMKSLWRLPKKFRRTMLNCTADGQHLCIGLTENLGDRVRTDLRYSYMGFRETFEAKPLGRIMRVATDGSGVEIVWEEQAWIGHVNTSPTQPNLLTFCHEGPWNLVDNRIWGFDLNTRTAWQIRPRENGDHPGHEYWLADGVRLGYHGRREDGKYFFGTIRPDNTDRLEFLSDTATGHMHSNDFSLIVGDHGQQVRLWKQEHGELSGPRELCMHRSSQHVQQVHVHPRFSPDGRQVLFTSDMSGYGNVYLADVPDRFEALPEL